MDETQEAVVDWLANGQVGVSSRCMAMWLGFGKRTQDEFGGYPHDPDDLDRCLKLLHRAPGLRERLPNMAELNKTWSALVARWDEIEASHLNEVGLGWTKARRAPKTYALMQEVIAGAMNDHDKRLTAAGRITTDMTEDTNSPNRPVDLLVSLRWSQERPTEPGWYWYEDEYYGPCPVEVDWTGFINRPEARQLEVVLACGDDSYQPIGEIANLSGKWAGPIQQPEAPSRQTHRPAGYRGKQMSRDKETEKTTGAEGTTAVGDPSAAPGYPFVRVMLEREITPKLPFGSLGTILPPDSSRWPDRGMYRIEWDAGFVTCMYQSELSEYRG